MRFRGRVYVFGNDIDTDQIVPGRYLELVRPEEIAPHAMEGADPAFASRFERGSLIIAGRNFGCGSSREHAPIALKAIGVSCVVADSFGRIFYRNAINVGLPVMRCPKISEKVREGDEVCLDLATGKVCLPGSGTVLQGERISADVLRIIESGGLVQAIKSRLKGSAK